MREDQNQNQNQNQTGAGAEDDSYVLPFIDEHALTIDAPVSVVWTTLTRKLAGWDTRASTIYACATGATPRRAAGIFPRQGSTLPGFAVNDVEPPYRLVLSGRHHFSRYVLTFILEAQGEITQLRARSHADFPGFFGQLYRVAVIGSGAHRAVTRRLLTSVLRNAIVHS